MGYIRLIFRKTGATFVTSSDAYNFAKTFFKLIFNSVTLTYTNCPIWKEFAHFIKFVSKQKFINNFFYSLMVNKEELTSFYTCSTAESGEYIYIYMEFSLLIRVATGQEILESQGKSKKL